MKNANYIFEQTQIKLYIIHDTEGAVVDQYHGHLTPALNLESSQLNSQILLTGRSRLFP